MTHVQIYLRCIEIMEGMAMFHGMHGCGQRRAMHGMRGGRWGGWDAGAWGGHERGGRRGRVFDGGELRLVLLKLIADEPRHGYDLIRAVEELSHGAYAPSPGVVYPTLTMLGDMGLIEEQAAEGARKRFAATDEGRAHLAEKRDEVEALLARLADLGATRARASGGAPIGRAMGNLAQAIAGRMSRGDFSEDTLHDAAALIDEVAQKIERLK